VTSGRETYAQYVHEALAAEIRALREVAERLDAEAVAQAADLIFACRGRVIVSGVGKAGLIGRKISATLASTGTPSHFLHAVEAIHGDLGRILEEDTVLLLSNSGETEVVNLLPALKRVGARTIGITGDPRSTLARFCDVVIDIGRVQEACPLGLAPTASTTVMLALGDALALAVARRRNFNREDYALYHPGGELGRRLMPVERVMRTGSQCPAVTGDVSVRRALERMTHVEGRAGAVCVVDAEGRLAGIFTDGDLRRHLLEGADFLDGPIAAVMTSDPKRAVVGDLAAEAGRLMKEHRIDDLPVVGPDGRLQGIVDIQDLLEARLIR